MDKYEYRRLVLEKILQEQCGGVAASLAKKIGKEPSYVTRMLYPEGKAGRKRIGEDIAELIESTFSISMAQESAQLRASPTEAADPKDEYACLLRFLDAFRLLPYEAKMDLTVDAETRAASLSTSAIPARKPG